MACAPQVGLLPVAGISRFHKERELTLGCPLELLEARKLTLAPPLELPLLLRCSPRLLPLLLLLRTWCSSSVIRNRMYWFSLCAGKGMRGSGTDDERLGSAQVPSSLSQQEARESCFEFT